MTWAEIVCSRGKGERALQEITPAATRTPGSGGFREATRELKSLTGSLERKLLLWLAARLPPWVNSDHLTALGLLAMVAAGGCYALSRRDPRWLHLVNVLLVVNWFGDSLDGTLARHRNRLRPRYGFYVDHIVDMYGFLALLGGLAVSPYMSRWVALGLLVVYYMLSIHIYLSTYTEGVFKIAYGKVGGTELRLIMIVGNLLLLVHPRLTVAGRSYALYDLAGALAIAGLAVTLVVSTLRSTRRLYQLERLDPPARTRPSDAGPRPS
jgi:archaetidylinositol phosphate synthase